MSTQQFKESAVKQFWYFSQWYVKDELNGKQKGNGFVIAWILYLHNVSTLNAAVTQYGQTNKYKSRHMYGNEENK